MATPPTSVKRQAVCLLTEVAQLAVSAYGFPESFATAGGEVFTTTGDRGSAALAAGVSGRPGSWLAEHSVGRRGAAPAAGPRWSPAGYPRPGPGPTRGG